MKREGVGVAMLVNSLRVFHGSELLFVGSDAHFMYPSSAANSALQLERQALQMPQNRESVCVGPAPHWYVADAAFKVVVLMGELGSNVHVFCSSEEV